MAHRLAVDIGNTTTKIAVFKNQTLIFEDKKTRFGVLQLTKMIKTHDVSYVIISTVKHLDKQMQTFIEENDYVLLMSPNLQLPFNVKYKTPETLGLDRLASIAGAWCLYPNQNSLVIDAGTCIKYDVITKDGHYLGGNIAPGLQMRLKAMHLFTSKLPHVAPYKRYHAMGFDTESALQVGACTGSLHEVRGFIADYKKTFGKLNILLTGGDALFFVNHLKTKIFAVPHLLLQGLNEILNYYVQENA